MNKLSIVRSILRPEKTAKKYYKSFRQLKRDLQCASLRRISKVLQDAQLSFKRVVKFSRLIEISHLTYSRASRLVTEASDRGG